MIDSFEFIRSVIDTVADHIVVIDTAGDILFVNKGWSTFGDDNACAVGKAWQGVNYLRECERAAATGDEFGERAAGGIKSVIDAVEDGFYLEYPCHSPDAQRWFMMRVTPFMHGGAKYLVISHQNITERKLAEEKVLHLSRIDGLTNIPNRRYFREFLSIEWARCKRLALPVSLAIVDIDHFKLLNDTYGHQAGDECLQAVGSILMNFVQRPGDLCARYGGEEFALVYGNTRLNQAEILADRVLDKIRSLKIPNEASPTLPLVTASIGLAMMRPDQVNSENDLIAEADKLLYTAKREGRNRVVVA